jgi:hypothetical protein
MPHHRIAPSAHLRQALHESLQHGIEQEQSPTSALLGLAARVVLQEALEAEQRDALGREPGTLWVQRRGAGDAAHAGGGVPPERAHSLWLGFAATPARRA